MRFQLFSVPLGAGSRSTAMAMHREAQQQADWHRYAGLEYSVFRWLRAASRTDVIPAEAGNQYSAANPMITGFPLSQE